MNNNRTSVATWTTSATKALESAHIPSARLDAELILSHTLQRPRTWLHAHHDSMLTNTQLSIAEARLQLRLEYIPIAYITGHKEFYGRLFQVNPSVLVPRPESESFFSLLSRITSTHRGSILDVGTGSGCIGISIKLEYPDARVTLSDISQVALTVAKKNAEMLHADVSFVASDLLDDIRRRFDIIVANLPYVDTSWQTPPDLKHEPASALYADDGGLAIIKKLIDQAVTRLNPAGFLLLEADPCQHAAIIDYALSCGYRHKETEDYIIALSRS